MDQGPRYHRGVLNQNAIPYVGLAPSHPMGTRAPEPGGVSFVSVRTRFDSYLRRGRVPQPRAARAPGQMFCFETCKITCSRISCLFVTNPRFLKLII